MKIHRLAICGVLVLSACAKPIEAASVTYDFVELGPNPGAIGAILEFSAPPASSSGGWETSSNGDILSFRILNGFFAPVGLYTASISTDVQSLTGEKLDAGKVIGMMAGFSVTATTGSSPFGDVLKSNHGRFMYGHWELVLPPVLGTHTISTFVAQPRTAAAVLQSLPSPPALTPHFSSSGVAAASAIPEPSALVLLGTAALMGLGLWCRRP